MMGTPFQQMAERPDLDALIVAARARGPMTADERFEQAVSFVYGNRPEENTMTKEQVRALVAEAYCRKPTKGAR